MYSVEDIMKITNKGRTYCYSLIKKLQEELKSQGKIVISGRIPKEYFDKKVLGK
jgi:CTP-dependent riboflavin kinase